MSKLWSEKRCPPFKHIKFDMKHCTMQINNLLLNSVNVAWSHLVQLPRISSFAFRRNIIKKQRGMTWKGKQRHYKFEKNQNINNQNRNPMKWIKATTCNTKPPRVRETAHTVACNPCVRELVAGTFVTLYFHSYNDWASWLDVLALLTMKSYSIPCETVLMKVNCYPWKC